MEQCHCGIGDSHKANDVVEMRKSGKWEWLHVEVTNLKGLFKVQEVILKYAISDMLFMLTLCMDIYALYLMQRNRRIVI